METTFLNSFALAAQTGSFAEAARRQDLTPAAIAQQVRVLERELGVPLFKRVGRTMQLTATGHRVLAQAQALLLQERHLRDAARDDALAGELRLGTINTALHSMLPALLGRFATSHPQVRVLIQSATTQHLVQALRDESIDVAVCLNPPFTLPKTLAWELLREEPLIVLAPLALAGHEPLQLLREQPFLRYDRELGGGQQAAQFLASHAIEPYERFELSSLLAIGLMVDQGLGVSLVPDIDSPLIQGLRIARLPVPPPRPIRRFGVLWRRGGRREDLVNAFLIQARTLIAEAGR